MCDEWSLSVTIDPRAGSPTESEKETLCLVSCVICGIYVKFLRNITSRSVLISSGCLDCLFAMTGAGWRRRRWPGCKIR